MTFIAGAYTAVYQPSPAQGGGSPLSLGIVEDGFRLSITNYIEPIRGDNLGETVQDGVYRGRDVFLSCVVEQALLASVLRSVYQPWLAAVNVSLIGNIGLVGRLASSVAGALQLTAIPGTTAAMGIASLYAGAVILAPGQDIQYLMATRLNKVAVRWQLLPYLNSGVWTHFQMTPGT